MPSAVLDLRVLEPVEVAQHHGLALLLGQLGDRGLQLLDGGSSFELGLRPSRVAEVGVDQRQRLPHPCVCARGTLVPRDRGEPGRRLSHVASSEQRLIRGDERRLRGVVRVVRVSQKGPAEAVHHPAVLLEELGGLRAGDPLLRVAGTTDRINCHRRRV